MGDRNDGAIMAIAGVIAVVVLGMWAMKFIQALFVQIGHTMDAFGVMVISVSGALWAIAQIALLVSLTVGAVVGAVYSTYKYVLLVKRGTEIQNAVALQLEEFRHTVDHELVGFQDRVQNQVGFMRRQLEEALKEPEAAPVPVVPTQPTVELLAPAPEGESVMANQTDSNADMSAVNNPF